MGQSGPAARPADIPLDEPRTLRRATLGPYGPRELMPNLGERLAGRRRLTPDVDDGAQAACRRHRREAVVDPLQREAIGDERL